MEDMEHAELPPRPEPIPWSAAVIVLVAGGIIGGLIYGMVDMPMMQREKTAAMQRTARVNSRIDEMTPRPTISAPPAVSAPIETEPKFDVTKQKPLEIPKTPGNLAPTDDFSPKPDATRNAAAAAIAAASADKKGKGKKTPPMDPFGHGMQPLPGMLPPADGSKLNQQQVLPPTAQGEITFCRVSPADVASGVSRIASAARAAGASVTRFEDWDSAAGKGMPALVVLLPPAKVQAFLKQIGATIVEEWQGDSEDRRARLTRSYKTKLNELRKRREELLIKYLETAPNVRDINEDIDHQTAALDVLKNVSLPDNMSVVRITITQE
ncbi:MAG: hypothetical protein JSS72_13645 [Armatimonadetes bacterium]|nr:hypothetical protein [Armatimonadota bacterium]